MRFARACLIAAPLVVLLGCAAQPGGSDGASFSNCFKREIREQISWCLAGESSGDFYRAAGRHQIIYGRYNDEPGLVKDGLSFCLSERDDRSLVNACKPPEVLELAGEQLPEADAAMCEATVDPRTSPAGC